jgi:phosphoribosyl 1,2-cyclic phosphodiesterase
MKVRFWGVRGSIPVPGPTTVRYGGNTSCLEVTGADGECIMLEAGSGLRVAGMDMLGRGGIPHIHLFISHTHWDHIQGFPFFVPAYIPGTQIDVKGPVHFVQDRPLKEAFDVQMRYDFFPISTQQLGAEISYEAIAETALEIGGVKIRSQFTNHPIRSCGYRLTENGKTIVYTGDHEPYYNMFEAPEGEEDDEEDDLLFGDVADTVDDANARFVDFVRDADVFICDCQYKPEEYAKDKKNWGHSSWDYCLQWMKDSGAKQMILTHHDPMRSDDQVDAMQEEIRAAAADMGLDPDTIQMAREGLEIEL